MRVIVLKTVLPLQLISLLVLWLCTWFYPLYLINVNMMVDNYVLGSVNIGFNNDRFCYLSNCYKDKLVSTSTTSLQSQVGFTYEGTLIDTFAYTAKYAYALYAILLAVSIPLFIWKRTKLQGVVLLGWTLVCNLTAVCYLVQYSGDLKSFLEGSLKEVTLEADILVERQFTYAFYLHVLQYLLYGLFCVLLLIFRKKGKIEFTNNGYEYI